MSYSLCGTSVANTGEQNCDKSKGVLRKLFIFNGSVAAADYASQDAFFTLMTANAKLTKTATNKVFPINEAQDIVDASTANKEGSLGLGFTTVLIEGKPGYKIKVFAGADLLKRYRSFNNQIVRFVEFDANGVFWGTKVGTSFKGYQAKLFFTGGKLATGQNVEEGVVEFSLAVISNSEYIDNSVWMESTGNIEDLTPLIDVNLTYISKAANVYKIGITIPGSNLIGPYNIYDEQGAAIAALAFTAGTGVNYGTALAVTSTVVDPVLKALTITFDGTAFGLLGAATPIKIFPPIPSVLDAADVTETELLPVIVTK